MENGWALGKSPGEFAQARRLTLGSSNLVYFCEPTLRTQLHMSVCVQWLGASLSAMQRNVCTWVNSGSRLHSLEMT